MVPKVLYAVCLGSRCVFRSGRDFGWMFLCRSFDLWPGAVSIQLLLYAYECVGSDYIVEVLQDWHSMCFL